MRPKKITFAAETAAIPLDYKQSPFSVSLQLVVTGGTVSVQHTYDDPFSTVATWINHSSLHTKTTGTYDGSYSAPVRAIRITGTNPAGALTIVQGQR